MSESPAPRRIGYYLLVIAGGIVVHQGFFVDAFGASVSDFFRRNSEAYALMVLVPLYWDVFGWASTPRAPTVTIERDGGWWRNPRLAGWLAVLVICAVITQSSALDRRGIDLAQSVVTLGEAFVGAIAISIYIAWSRAVPTAGAVPSGAAVEPWIPRFWYYVGVVVVSALTYQSTTASVVGTGVVDWLKVNIEALSAMIVIPLYFDAIAWARSAQWSRLVWYPALVAIPALTQTDSLDGLAPSGILDWLGRSTEAFIAAIAISVYFDVWRGDAGEVHRSSVGGKVPDRIV